MGENQGKLLEEGALVLTQLGWIGGSGALVSHACVPVLFSWGKDTSESCFHFSHLYNGDVDTIGLDRIMVKRPSHDLNRYLIC